MAQPLRGGGPELPIARFSDPLFNSAELRAARATDTNKHPV